MAEVQQRLRPVQADLSAVPSPSNTERAAAATFPGCGEDSGEVFEPEVSREWRLSRDARGSLDAFGHDHLTKPARGTGIEITSFLISRGWIGRPPHGRYAATTLRTQESGNRTFISIQVCDDSVLAIGWTAHDKVCGPII